MILTTGRLTRPQAVPAPDRPETLLLRVFGKPFLRAHLRSVAVTLRMAEDRARREGRLLIAVQYPDGATHPSFLDARITISDPRQQLTLQPSHC